MTVLLALRRGRWLLLPGNNIGRQAFALFTVAQRDDDGLLNGGMQQERGLNLARFDTMPLNLDLEIFSAEQFERAIRQIATRIARAVEAFPQARMDDEAVAVFSSSRQ